MQHLTGAQAVARGPVRLHGIDRTRFIAPSVVDQQLGILPEELEEKFLVRERAPRDVAHCEHPVLLKLLGVPLSHAPKIRERCVAPQLFAVAAFIQFSNAHAVFICRYVLGDYVHRDLAEVQVRTYAGRRRNAGRI